VRYRKRLDWLPSKLAMYMIEKLLLDHNSDEELKEEALKFMMANYGQLYVIGPLNKYK